MKKLNIVSAITKPAALVLNKLPIIGKFSVISVAFIMPALIGVGVMYNKLSNDVQQITKKQTRLQYIPKMYEVVKLNADTRLLHYQSLLKNNPENALKNEVKKLETLVSDFTNDASMDNAVAQAGSQLKGTINLLNKTTSENLSSYHKVAVQAMIVNDVIVGSSDLFVEDAPETYLYGDLIGQQVLPYVELFSEIQAISSYSSGRSFSKLEKEQVNKLLNDSRSAFSNLMRTYEKMQARALVNPELEGQFKIIKGSELLLNNISQKISTDESSVHDDKPWKNVTASLYGINNSIYPLLQQQFESTYQSRYRVLTSVLALYAIAGALSFYLLLAFYSSLSISMSRLVYRLQKFKNGDFTKTNDGSKSSDEIGRVLRSADEVADTLATLVGRAQNSGLVLFQTSKHIATGTMELHRRTEQQGQALQKVRERMHDLTGTVRQNVENASTANKLSNESAQLAKEGGNIMNDVVDSMTRMRQSSERVGEIVKMIQEIASRTDILAINATIEAARAGDAGRGFAVVAGEVRKLSVRSAMAAQEIQELVLTQNEQVLASSDVIENAKTKLDSIVKSTNRVNGIMSAISSASKEQDTGITATNESVVLMQQIAKVNTQLVAATSKTSKTLQVSADNLRKDMAQFKIDSDKQQMTTVTSHMIAPPPVQVVKKQETTVNSDVFVKKGDTPLQPGATPNEFEQF